MNEIFKYCVDLLYYWAALTGITYEEINVIIFCIVGPIIFIGQWCFIIHQRKKLMRILSKVDQNLS
jgi:hypothetical protein